MSSHRAGVRLAGTPIGVLVPFLLSVASLIWLLTMSVIGARLFHLYLALGVFAACTALWVVVQFVHGRSTSRLVLIVAASVLAAAGLTLLAVFVFGSPLDGFPLVGAVLVYLAAGWYVEVLRRTPEVIGWTRGDLGLFVGVAALVVGAVLLPHAGKGASYLAVLAVLGLALLVLIPVGLNLMSEHLLTLLAPRPRIAYVVTAIGVVLAAAMVVVAGVIGHSWAIAGIAAACAAVLMTAIASDTHADVLIVVGVLALIGAATPEVSTPPWVSPLPAQGQTTLLALGDSYMSGEGAATYYKGTDEGGRDECRRAPTAYAARAAGPGRRFQNVTFLACSGARTYNILPSTNGGFEQTGEPGTQLDQVQAILQHDPAFRPALVIVSIGGNDAGFATIGEACIAPGNCDTISSLFTENLQGVFNALLQTYDAIKVALPGVPIAAVPYPRPLAPSTDCNDISLSASERAFVSSFVDQLDENIRQVAQLENILYVDTMPDALAAKHLQLCDPARHGRAGINAVDLKSVNGLADERFSPIEWLHSSLHPNALGHAAMLDALNRWLGAHPTLANPTPPAQYRAIATAQAPAPQPPCSFSVTGSGNCGTQARDWEFGQIRDLWPWGIAFAAGLAGVWLVAVGVLSRWRAMFLTPH